MTTPANQPPGQILPPVRPSSFLKRSLGLLIALLGAQVLLGSLALATGSTGSLLASFAALLTSIAGGCIALMMGDFLCWLLHQQFAGFAQAVCGMLVRASVSLGACAVVYGFSLGPAQHGFVFFVLVYYMVTLTVETVFAVRQFSEAEGYVTDSAGENA